MVVGGSDELVGGIVKVVGGIVKLVDTVFSEEVESRLDDANGIWNSGVTEADAISMDVSVTPLSILTVCNDASSDAATVDEATSFPALVQFFLMSCHISFHKNN